MPKFKTVNIKGKNYIPVNERLKYFREKHPGYSLRTELIAVDERSALIKAVIRDAEDRIIAEGTAHERADQKGSLVNNTSHVENCYHPDTEVLTSDGWKKISLATSHDKIAQVDLVSGEVSFAFPLDKVVQEGKSFLVIEDNLTKQVVTPDHDVVLGDQKVKAGDVRVADEGQRSITNDLRHTASYEGRGLPESPKFCAVLQWVIADGHIDYEHHHVKFGFIKRRKFARLTALLEEEGIPYTTFEGENGVLRVNIRDAKRIIAYLPRKTLTFGLAMTMSHAQAEAFIQEIPLTDGMIDTRGGIYLRQTDREYIDNLNMLAVFNGYSVGALAYDEPGGAFPNGKPIHRARYKKGIRRTATVKTEFGERATAYCFTMPYGTLVTRFDGKITISGNCETSAWGRALGNFGIGIDDSVATADEVATAIAKQGGKPAEEEYPETTAQTVKTILQLCRKLGKDELKMWKHYGVQDGKPTYEQSQRILYELSAASKNLSKELDAAPYDARR